jgi:puromycin-sensitive aminopeptidase
MTDPSAFRLPTAAVPRHYRLRLEPDLDALRYTGEVEIDLDVRRATPEVVLHAVDLDIAEAWSGSEKLELRPEPARERLALVSARGFEAGAATLRLVFSAALREDMKGFYRSRYTRADGSPGTLATTQFEATSARRCFPCFDEPAHKARFDVTLTAPKGRTAISNMPEAAAETLPDGRRRVRFATSPVMSTYLLAFIVGEFESIEGATKDGVPVRVYSTPGRKELCRFALETAIRGLEFFDAYYGIPYKSSLPKCDLIAIPDFEFGAMENWGAITFRETALFVDPKISSIPQRRRVAEVVLHELAHQWFGNLVTPEWWSFLWLNESFATFMAYWAVDVLFPDWKIWEEYLSAITSAGRSLDSLRTSHPVEVPVHDSSEVDQIFDAISYNKGGSVLRMLAHAIGAEAFKQGVRNYLKRHAYACATTDDLWAALGPEASAMMDGWTRRIGYPVVSVKREAGSLALRQERFLLDRDPARPDEDPTLWRVPLFPVAGSGPMPAAWLEGRSGTLPRPAADWVKLNAHQGGFFAVQYDDAGWQDLAKAVERGALGSMDRYGLQEDGYALMRAGYLPVPSYLRLAGAFSREENPHVWGGVADGLAALTDIYVGDAAVPKLEAWARSLLARVTALVGWEEKPDEAIERRLLRPTVLGAALRFGDPAAVAGARERFEALRTSIDAVGPNIRSIILWGTARHGGEDTYRALVELHEKSDLPEVKVQALRALGASKDAKILRRAVAYALSDKVRRQDAAGIFSSVPIDVKPAAWALFQEHWPTIDERYGKSGFIGHWIAAAAAGIPTGAHAAEVEAFFRAHPAPYGSEKLRQTLEGIRARAKFRERNRSGLADFFAT